MTPAGCCGWAASGSGHRPLQSREMVAGSGQATAVPEQLAAVKAQRQDCTTPKLFFDLRVPAIALQSRRQSTAWQATDVGFHFLATYLGRHLCGQH